MSSISVGHSHVLSNVAPSPDRLRIRNQVHDRFGNLLAHLRPLKRRAYTTAALLGATATASVADTMLLLYALTPGNSMAAWLASQIGLVGTRYAMQRHVGRLAHDVNAQLTTAAVDHAKHQRGAADDELPTTLRRLPLERANINRAVSTHLPFIPIDVLTFAGFSLSAIAILGANAIGLAAAGALGAVGIGVGTRYRYAMLRARSDETRRAAITEQVAENMHALSRSDTLEFLRNWEQLAPYTRETSKLVQQESDALHRYDRHHQRSGVEASLTTSALLFACISAAQLAATPTIAIPALMFLVPQAVLAASRIPSNLLLAEPGLAAAERLNRALDTPPRIAEPLERNTLDIDTTRPTRISLDRASLRYPNGRVGLDDVTLRIRSGETVAVTGPNWSGKSSLLHAISLRQSLTAGSISINGVPINRLRHATIDSMVRLLPVEPHIRDATLADNVRIANPSASDKEIKHALRTVGLLGAKGSKRSGLALHANVSRSSLSSGQAKRIELARALVSTAPIQLMKEPTATLDGDASQIVAALRTRARQRGQILIIETNNPTIATQTDRILTMTNGSLVNDSQQVARESLKAAMRQHASSISDARHRSRLVVHDQECANDLFRTASALRKRSSVKTPGPRLSTPGSSTPQQTTNSRGLELHFLLQ